MTLQLKTQSILERREREKGGLGDNKNVNKTLISTKKLISRPFKMMKHPRGY
jgi:hypothetical protein